jgi:FdhD protein
MALERAGDLPRATAAQETEGGRAVRVPITEIQQGGREERDDEAVTEEPLEIRVAEAPPSRVTTRVAVTLRTPGEDFELAAGFLVAEGLLHERREVARISYCTDPAEPQRHNVVQVLLAPGVGFDAERLRRNFFTNSSCGLCGKAALEQVRAVVPARPASHLRVSAEVLGSLPDRIAGRQRVFGRTGGLHGAALFRPDGELLLLREDVGRHNAVDKVVGHEFLEGRLGERETMLLVTGRAGFELVQKAAVAGIPLLAALGAPSSLAIALAEEQGMTLVGFLREDRFNLYAGRERIGPDATVEARR